MTNPKRPESLDLAIRALEAARATRQQVVNKAGRWAVDSIKSFDDALDVLRAERERRAIQCGEEPKP